MKHSGNTDEHKQKVWGDELKKLRSLEKTHKKSSSRDEHLVASSNSMTSNEQSSKQNNKPQRITAKS